MSSPDKHVQLIDDDPDMHDIVRLILERLGYRVSCYSTGPAGMEALRREPPDVLLLDIMLASPTEGLVLANDIKSDGDLKAIPIIMISSIGHSLGADYAREVGADSVPVEDFLEKPLAPHKLRAAVNRVFENHA